MKHKPDSPEFDLYIVQHVSDKLQDEARVFADKSPILAKWDGEIKTHRRLKGWNHLLGVRDEYMNSRIRRSAILYRKLFNEYLYKKLS